MLLELISERLLAEYRVGATVNLVRDLELQIKLATPSNWGSSRQLQSGEQLVVAGRGDWSVGEITWIL
jgi:hypothetical protein